MKTVQDFIFSEKIDKAMDDSIARGVARADAACLPKAYLDNYDQLPAKPVKSVQDFIFSKEFRRGISEGIREAVASSEAAGLPRSYLHSYEELPEFLTQLRDYNKPAE